MTEEDIAGTLLAFTPDAMFSLSNVIASFLLHIIYFPDVSAVTMLTRSILHYMKDEAVALRMLDHLVGLLLKGPIPSPKIEIRPVTKE